VQRPCALGRAINEEGHRRLAAALFGAVAVSAMAPPLYVRRENATRDYLPNLTEDPGTPAAFLVQRMAVNCCSYPTSVVSQTQLPRF
jgi:hypothetical protein